jgi:hypothetical protein
MMSHTCGTRGVSRHPFPGIAGALPLFTARDGLVQPSATPGSRQPICHQTSPETCTRAARSLITHTGVMRHSCGPACVVLSLPKRGGLASHAAVVVQKLSHPCAVVAALALAAVCTV